jgi:hypothetical protein
MGSRLVSLIPVQIGSWYVQASVLDNDSICVIVRHKNNLRCFVKFFTDEEKANMFVRSIVYKRGQLIFDSDSAES